MLDKKKDTKLPEMELPELAATIEKLEQATLPAASSIPVPVKLKAAIEKLETYLDIDPAQVPSELVAEVLSYYSRGKLIALEAIGGDGYVISYLDEISRKLVLKIARPKKVGWEMPAKAGIIKSFSEAGQKIKTISISRERFRDGCAIQLSLHNELVAAGIQEFVIPGVFFFSETPTLHLVMEYVPGIAYLRWVKEAKNIITSLRLFCVLLRAVAFIHKYGIVHRDLKPENIITTGKIIGVIDFNTARRQERNLTLSGAAVGSKTHAAPEQMEDAKTATEVSDVFSLGILFWETVLAEAAPRPLNLNLLCEEDKAQYVTDLETKLPPAFRAIFKNSANCNPDKRYQDCGYFLKAVEAKIAELDTSQKGVDVKAQPSGSLETRIEFLERKNDYLEKKLYEIYQLAEMPETAETCPFLAYLQELKRKGNL